MNIEEFREYCLSLKGAWECTPFDEATIVFKIGLPEGKNAMFALISTSRPDCAILRCNPEKAIELREKYNAITPAYHMNKQHWNGIDIESPELTTTQIQEFTRHSYSLIMSKLPKSVRDQINL